MNSGWSSRRHIKISVQSQPQMFPTRKPLPSGLTTSVVPIVMFSFTSFMFGIVVFSVRKIDKYALTVKILWKEYLKKNSLHFPYFCIEHLCAYKDPWDCLSTCLFFKQKALLVSFMWVLMEKTQFCSFFVPSCFTNTMRKQCKPWEWKLARTM